MARDGHVRVRLEERDIQQGALHLTKGNSKWMNGVARTKITDKLTIGASHAVHQATNMRNDTTCCTRGAQ
jgi:hypothetical protein